MSDIGHYESNFEHKLHSPWEKSVIERTVEYLKDRTEACDDYYYHVYRWLNLFIFMHDKVVEFRTKFDNMRRSITITAPLWPS